MLQRGSRFARNRPAAAGEAGGPDWSGDCLAGQPGALCQRRLQGQNLGDYHPAPWGVLPLLRGGPVPEPGASKRPPGGAHDRQGPL